jgi:imidazolonepropionase-like amidohydrolase
MLIFKTHRIVIAIALIFFSRTLFAEETPVVIRGAQIHTIASGVIDNGTVLVEGGKVAAVGKNIDLPSNAQIIDARGLIVTPGIIDARSYLGLGFNDMWESSTPVVPQLHIIESFQGISPGHDWLKAGVTAVYITPGPQNVIGGFGAVVKMAGRPSTAIVSEEAGMSASMGEVPKQSFEDEAPQTRMGTLSLIRESLLDAQEYINIRPAKRDLAMEALGKVIRKQIPLRVQVNTPDDIANVLRLKKELDIDLVIDCGVGAHVVAHKLAAAGVPVVVGPNMIGAGGGGRFEFFAHTEENAARLHKAGVRIALSTDDAGGRSVVLEAAVSRAHGLPEAEALRAVTLNAAEILGVSDRLGSIEKGKDADLVVWDKHPLSTWGRTVIVMIDGKVVFERDKDLKKSTE